jgi:hypothetical protein
MRGTNLIAPRYGTDERHGVASKERAPVALLLAVLVMAD